MTAGCALRVPLRLALANLSAARRVSRARIVLSLAARDLCLATLDLAVSPTLSGSVGRWRLRSPTGPTKGLIGSNWGTTFNALGHSHSGRSPKLD